MGEISLEGISVFAHHGFYEEERNKGNNFTVDITIRTDFSEAARSDDISGTINYEKLYYIISREMAIPSKLLEHVTNRIVERTLEEFNSIKFIKVSVTKDHPPLPGACKKAKITITRELN